MLILLICSNGRIISSFPKQYVPYQFLFVFTSLVSALLSTDVEAAIYVVLSYSSTFIFNFLILYYLFKRGFRRRFVAILCIVVSVAALIGITEGIARYYLPLYRDWFLSYDYERMHYAMIRSDFRVLGTQGDPITYSAAMVLALPFVLEIRRRILKRLLAALLVTAILFAVSTTAAVMCACLLIGFLVIYKRRAWLKIVVATMVALSLLFLVLRLSPSTAYLVSAWTQEFAFGDMRNEQMVNIQVRLDLVVWELRHFEEDLDFVNMLFGHGLKSTIQDVIELGMSRLATTDNQYIALLLEAGVLGLVSFLAVGFSVLVGYRWAIGKSLHWYAVLSLLIAGMSFTPIYYTTFNFVWVASVAALAYDTKARRQRELA